VVLHVEEDVRVGVDDDAYGAVAKEFLKQSWVNSSRKEQCSACVAEVVEADGAQPNIKQQRLEAPLVYVGRFKELTNLCSEYESCSQCRRIPALGVKAAPYRCAAQASSG
jgi:hypothetical protein